MHGFENAIGTEDLSALLSREPVTSIATYTRGAVTVAVPATTQVSTEEKSDATSLPVGHLFSQSCRVVSGSESERLSDEVAEGRAYGVSKRLYGTGLVVCDGVADVDTVPEHERV